MKTQFTFLFLLLLGHQNTAGLMKSLAPNNYQLSGTICASVFLRIMFDSWTNCGNRSFLEKNINTVAMSFVYFLSRIYVAAFSNDLLKSSQ